MIINAVIESKDGGTLVLDFPRSIYDVYEKLQSVGIRQSPHQITLSDEEGDDVRVKLYSEDEIGKHLLLTLKEHNSLADANMLAFMVDNAKPDFRSKLEQNLLNDQYSSMQEVTDDIKQMLYESGPVKAVFYCPLVGEVTDEEGFSSPVDGSFLKSYAWAVEEALEADTADDEMDMAEFFDEDDGVKAKLVSAKWGWKPTVDGSSAGSSAASRKNSPMRKPKSSPTGSAARIRMATESTSSSSRLTPRTATCTSPSGTAATTIPS